MRAKQFYGSGAGMNINIDDKLFHNLKPGTRLIIKTDKTRTINLQVVYPLIKKYKSKVLQILPGNEKEIYIDTFYWGEAFNPTMLFIYDRPDFNIEIVKLDSAKGNMKFNEADKFRDSYDQITVKNMP
jgi:hypothetical protein